MKITQPCKLIFSMIFLTLFGSITTAFAQQGEARKIDEYGKIRAKDENARLDNFVIEMKADANTEAYIISYGGRRTSPKEALMMANRAKTYTMKKGKLKASRIITINGGYKEEPTTELWLVPEGTIPPDVSPTVDPSEVTPPKVVKKSKSKKPVKRKK